MPELAPIWEKSFGEPLRSAAISSDGKFMALETDHNVLALDRAGALVWEVPLKRISPYLINANPATGPSGRPMAIAAGGEWALISGDSSYKYIWRIGGRGGEWFFATHGTPYSLALAEKRDLIAIGTGANTIHMISPQGKPIRNVSRGDWNWIVDSLAFCADDTSLLVQGEGRVGVLSLGGEFKWLSDWTDMHASVDLRLFAARRRPGHGPPFTELGMLGEDGRLLWNRGLWDGEFLIAPDGRFGVISGISMGMNVPWPDIPGPAPVVVVDPGGKTLIEKTLPWHTLSFIAADSQTIVALLRERNSWKAKLTGFNKELLPVWQISDAPADERGILHHASGLVVIFDAFQLRTYQLPNAKN